VRPALDPQGFVDYHTFRFVPGPHTMIRGVEKLKAAECGVVTAGALQRWKYWSPWKVRPTAHVRASAGARAGRLRNDLFDAVCCQAATQVPSGILLSGGLDSTALLAIHRHIFGHAPDTYTISFTPPRGQAKRSEYDEADYAEEVAGWYQSRHTHEQVSARQVLDMLPRIVADLDEPVADPTAIPLWFACRMAHEAGVKVLFSGEGLDELFGGYGVYQQVRWLRALQMLPVTLRQSLSNFLARFELPGSGVMRRSTRPVWDWYQGVGGLFSSHERKALFLQPVQKWLGSYDPDCHMHRCLLQSNAIRTPDVLTQMMVFDFCTWLPENTLIKSDKVSMAHSIELRVPFLDRRVVEYAWSLPVDDKVHGRTGKWIVRRALSGIVPPFVLRRQKAGFPVPLTAWMFGEWKEFAWDTLLNPRSVTRQYYRGDAIARLFNIEPAQRRRAARLLWAMITLELWIQHLQMTSATGFDLPSCALSK
ncbi:MAG: asparagine synthase C-terminal domain-containing protein, partial [Alicyclobacillus macrosporangiidus]|nr:asparagine synthase C-terminal domain-containing protein [Alicyclobacillus macrosporangiidus]